MRPTHRTAQPAVLELVLLALLGSASAEVGAQNHVIDLRFEVSEDGDRTYHNGLWSWSFADRFSLEAFWLFLPQLDDYNEPGLGLGYKLLRKPQLSVSLIGLLASAPDDEYFEPAVLVTDTEGRLTGSLFLLRYIPLSDRGIDQWLIDPAEVQLDVGGPVAVGVSGYFYRPQVGPWLRKLGPKISVTDAVGATELAVRRSNQGSWEIQFRRLFFF